MTLTAKVGASGLVIASVAASVAQGTVPTSNFISELGVPGRRLARTFRAGQAAAGLACVHLAVRALAQDPPSHDGRHDARLGTDVAHRAPERGRRLLTAAVTRAGGELRGVALGAVGGCLLVTAAVPSSPGCPLPVLDGRVPFRDWVHVPAAMTAFHLLPVAASGRLRRQLAVNLALLGPPTLFAPHGHVTAVLQRSMTLLGALALATWSPSGSETRAANLARCRWWDRG
jgi:hypothetical protein